MSENRGREASKAYLATAFVILVIISLIPVFCSAAYNRAGIFYGSLFFVVMLGVAVLLVLRVGPFSEAKTEQRDYRVVHFTLRLALAFAIGAVIIGVLLVASTLGVIPSS